MVEAEQELLSEVDLRRLQAALLHPSVRSEVEKDLAAVQLCQSQKTRKVKDDSKKIPKLLRADRAMGWRSELAKKRNLESALWPIRGKAKSARSKKSLRKRLKKRLLGKVWTKLSKTKRAHKAFARRTGRKQSLRRRRCQSTTS